MQGGYGVLGKGARRARGAGDGAGLVAEDSVGRRYQEQWVENCMMQLMVDDVDAWWAHVTRLDLPRRFGVRPPQPPAVQPWGLRVLYLTDPSGILWHIAQRRHGVVHD